MMAPEKRTRGALRIGVVALLLLAAFFTALPWLGCSWNPVRGGLEPTMLGICTFGFASGPWFPPKPWAPWLYGSVLGQSDRRGRLSLCGRLRRGHEAPALAP